MSMDTLNKLSRESILKDMTHIIKDMTSDWDMGYSGNIGSDTHLIGELGFESIDVIYLVTAIEGRYKQRNLPFEKVIMGDGRYRDDFTLGEVVDFLHMHLLPIEPVKQLNTSEALERRDSL